MSLRSSQCIKKVYKIKYKMDYITCKYLNPLMPGGNKKVTHT